MPIKAKPYKQENMLKEADLPVVYSEEEQMHLRLESEHSPPVATETLIEQANLSALRPFIDHPNAPTPILALSKQLAELFTANPASFNLENYTAHAQHIVGTLKQLYSAISLLTKDSPSHLKIDQKAFAPLFSELTNIYEILEDHGWQCGTAPEGLMPASAKGLTQFMGGLKGKKLISSEYSNSLKSAQQIHKLCHALIEAPAPISAPAASHSEPEDDCTKLIKKIKNSEALFQDPLITGNPLIAYQPHKKETHTVDLGFTPLFYAAKYSKSKGNIPCLLFHCTQAKEITQTLNSTITNQNNPYAGARVLMISAQFGTVASLNEIVDAVKKSPEIYVNYAISKKGPYEGWTALHFACKTNSSTQEELDIQLQKVTILLDKNANINAATKAPVQTPLTMSLSQGNIALFRLLMQRGAVLDPDLSNYIPIIRSSLLSRAEKQEVCARLDISFKVCDTNRPLQSNLSPALSGKTLAPAKKSKQAEPAAAATEQQSQDRPTQSILSPALPGKTPAPSKKRKQEPASSKTAAPVLHQARIGLFNYEDDIQQARQSQQLLSEKLNPFGFKIGFAYSEGDCFFDSIAQSLENRKIINPLVHPGQGFSLKHIRQLCQQEAIKMKNQPQSWLVPALTAEKQNIAQYAHLITLSAEDLQDGPIGGIETAIWGRAHIEGRLVCSALNISLHFIELALNADNQLVIMHHLINAQGKSAIPQNRQELYNNPNIIHIAVYQRTLHFVPLIGSALASSHANPQHEIPRTEAHSFSPLFPSTGRSAESPATAAGETPPAKKARIREHSPAAAAAAASSSVAAIRPARPTPAQQNSVDIHALNIIREQRKARIRELEEERRQLEVQEQEQTQLIQAQIVVFNQHAQQTKQTFLTAQQSLRQQMQYTSALQAQLYAANKTLQALQIQHDKAYQEFNESQQRVENPQQHLFFVDRNTRKLADVRLPCRCSNPLCFNGLYARHSATQATASRAHESAPIQGLLETGRSLFSSHTIQQLRQPPAQQHRQPAQDYGQMLPPQALSRLTAATQQSSQLPPVYGAPGQANGLFPQAPHRPMQQPQPDVAQPDERMEFEVQSDELTPNYPFS